MIIWKISFTFLEDKPNMIIRKIFRIIFIVAVLCDIVCLSCNPLFGVEIRYDNAIFYSIYITLISSFALIPMKRVMMWIFYPVIVLAMTVNFFSQAFFDLKFTTADYIQTYKSPHNKNTLIIGTYKALYWGTDCEYSFYKSTGIFFKKKICNNVTINDMQLFVETIRWIDDYNVSIQCQIKSKGKFSDFKINLR